MILLDKLKNIPSSSGVYQYFNKDGHLLYIGKAKNLKNRVKSYFKFTPKLEPSNNLSPRIYKMISEVYNLEWIITSNENDALILENSLIKQLKPKYNVLLRDDKTYPYLYIDYSQDFPRIELTRKIIKGKNIKYFGPYSIGARDILDSIYEIVPLVQKKSCLASKQACLFHQINKCYAPCENKITKENYRKIIDKALEYIYNKNKLINKLKLKMQEYSQNCRFEEALTLRDRIKSIEKSKLKSSMDLTNNQNLDIFAIKIVSSQAIVVRLFIREGKLTSSNHDLIKIDFNEDIQNNENEILNESYKRAIINYYDNDIPILPNEIIVANEILYKNDLISFIKTKFNKKIDILYPQIGNKKELINIALNNCDELLRINNISNSTLIYKDIKNLFKLEQTPYRIETFDNSHMMGQATVGAMVVWDDNKFDKKSFRHYNLNFKDEYSQMKELLTRRVEKFKNNPAPNLWIIDGGSTLLKLALDICQSIGILIDIIAISKEKIDSKSKRSKGSAKDILYHKNGIHRLLSSDKRLQFIQRQRDEAHRFAITFHKKQKRVEDKQISLLQLKGIGEVKVKKLLLYFGTFENIKKASLNEFKNILNEKDSIMIIEHFKNMD